jgi:hypothetical protein
MDKYTHTHHTHTHTHTRKHTRTHTGQAHVPPDLVGQCLVQFADKDAAIRAAQVVCTRGELEESEKKRAREQLRVGEKRAQEGIQVCACACACTPDSLFLSLSSRVH